MMWIANANPAQTFNKLMISQEENAIITHWNNQAVWKVSPATGGAGASLSSIIER